jgi:hypothetical protein
MAVETSPYTYGTGLRSGIEILVETVAFDLDSQ